MFIMSHSAAYYLNYVHNSIFVKLFKSFDKSIIEQCHYYTGYLLFDTALELRRLQFLKKISKSPPSPANYMYKWFGAEEFRQLNAKLNIQQDVHSTC